MRLLIVGDLHIHPHFGDWRKVDDALDVLDWIFNTAIERDVDAVVFLGDIFHVRGYLYPSVLARAYNHFRIYRECGVEPIFIVGNHDMPFKNTTDDNSLTTLSDIGTVVDGLLVHDFKDWRFVFLPYVHNPNVITKHLDELDYRDNTFLFGHLDIVGAFMDSTNTISDIGLTIEYLESKFTATYTGHYHKYQLLGESVYYVGTPYQINFNEADQNKYIMLWDDGNVELLQNRFSPLHVNISLDQFADLDADRPLYIKLYISRATDIDDATDMLAQKRKDIDIRDAKIIVQPNQHMFDSSGILDDREENSRMDTTQLLQRWLDSIDTTLDKKRALSVGLDLIGESAS